MNLGEYVISVLQKTFKVNLEEYKNFKYPSLHIEQKQDCIYLDQQIYIDELKEARACKDRKISKKILLNTE